MFRFTIACLLGSITTLCIGQSEITFSLGYQLFEPREGKEIRIANNQHTPHLNLSWSYRMENVYSGITVFHNIDQIKREWFDEGEYAHTNYQKGFLIDFGIWQKINGKHYINVQPSIGFLWNNWELTTENENLNAIIAPRYSKNRITGVILLGYGYAITESTSLLLRAGYGLNNIQLGLKHEL